MAMFVNTNVASLNGQRNLQNVTDRMNSTFEKLSSGSRINSARDDSAGLQISNRLSTQITGLSQANRNANDGISIAQIAEGALGEITSNVQRMRQLAVQGGNRTLSTDDRNALGEEFSKLLTTNNDIANRTAYGTIKVLNYDSQSAGFQVQSGAQAGEQDTVTTGNAMLTSLFGKMLNEETTVTTGQELSAMSTANISSYGTLGKLVALDMMVNNNSIVSASNDRILGGTAVGAGLTSTLADNSAVQLDTAALTNILKFQETATAGSTAGAGADMAIAAGLGTALSFFTGFESVNVLSSGLDDTQLNQVHAFATDTLMDMMSGLVTQVDKQRAKLGAEQNGLSSTVRSNTASIVNVSDSRARIQDTDFATETAELTRNQIIQQAATSILSQANQLPNAALSLLR